MHLTLRVPWVMQQVSLRAILWMILSAFCFSAAELAAHLFIQDISLYQVVWGRYAVHILFMVVLLGPRYKRKLVITERPALHVLRSLTMVAMPVCFIVAANHMPAHDIWIMYWSAPLMMLALSVWVLREPAGMHRWIAAVVGFGGMLLVYQPDQGILNPAALLGLGAGLAISLHLMLSRVLRDDHPLTSLFHTGLWVFVVMSFVVPFLWQTPSPRTLIGITIIGLVGLLGLLVLARSGELVPLPVVASFSYTEALWRTLLSAVVLGVVPDQSVILGNLIIAAMTAYLLFYETTLPEPVQGVRQMP